MKLVVDSGSTKADWIAMNDEGEILFTTRSLGLNPEVLTSEEIIRRLEQCFDIAHNKNEVKSLFFYGAGCGTPRMKMFLTEVFVKYFINARVEVWEDTYAAVFATTPKNEKAIVCILGTGSNCSYFDGNELHQKVQSLGYIAMDDCSGNRFGRFLIRQYYFNKMPRNLAVEFEQKFDLEPDIVKHHFYKEPNPNAYLAQFAEFLIQHKEEASFKEYIYEEIESFVENYVLQYENSKELPVHFVGSIAFHLKDELSAVLKKYGLRMGNVLRKPIDGLIAYHTIK